MASNLSFQKEARDIIESGPHVAVSTIARQEDADYVPGQSLNYRDQQKDAAPIIGTFNMITHHIGDKIRVLNFHFEPAIIADGCHVDAPCYNEQLSTYPAAMASWSPSAKVPSNL